VPPRAGSPSRPSRAPCLPLARLKVMELVLLLAKGEAGDPPAGAPAAEAAAPRFRAEELMRYMD